MACNWRMAYRHNSYIIKKIPYRRILNRIKIVKLFKQPLSIVYRGKEKKALLAKTKRSALYKK